jgi:predicted DCC family thiol-disulfide oxidoreductase YuxK
MDAERVKPVDVEVGPAPRARAPGERILLFDGVCNLCNGWVRFVIRNDPLSRVRFAPLQSETGQWLLAAHRLPLTGESLVLIEEGKAFTASDAALRVARSLAAPWPIFALFLAVPRPIRDAVYRWVARNRYRWFGRRDECMVPTPEQRRRFLD